MNVPWLAKSLNPLPIFYRKKIPIQNMFFKHLPISTFQIPYLQLEIRDSWNLRKRRTLSRVCSKNKEEGGDHCCMESLKVDFNEDYQWSFVIYPTSFEPNYCSGDCSLGKMMPDNAYTQSGISPCCNPQKMGTLELLYMDENNNVVQGTLPKMMVQRCGCA